MAAINRYGKWILQGPAASEAGPQPPPPDKVALRLFCVPPAGMGAWCFHGWTKGLPDSVEVMPLDLPCRGARMGEALPYAASLAQLASDILAGISREVLSSRPFAFFGHSFGALVVFELCQELLRRSADGWPLPLKVYVSACRPPDLAGPAHDPDRANPTLSDLDGSKFWAAFEARYGLNPDLQAPYVREMVQPLIQADFKLVEAYVPSGLEPLPMPLCAVCASGDNRCRPSQLSAWAKRAGEGGFRERWFEDMLRPGSWATVHRYVVDNPRPLLRFLHADLPVVGAPVDGYSGVDGPLPGGDGEVEPSEEGQRRSPCAIS